jgi:hypothetical protein
MVWPKARTDPAPRLMEKRRVGEGEGEMTREPIVDFATCSPLETALPPCLTSASQETTSRTHPSRLQPPTYAEVAVGGGSSKKTYEPEASILAVIVRAEGRAVSEIV